MTALKAGPQFLYLPLSPLLFPLHTFYMLGYFYFLDHRCHHCFSSWSVSQTCHMPCLGISTRAGVGKHPKRILEWDPLKYWLLVFFFLTESLPILTRLHVHTQIHHACISLDVCIIELFSSPIPFVPCPCCILKLFESMVTIYKNECICIF